MKKSPSLIYPLSQAELSPQNKGCGADDSAPLSGFHLGPASFRRLFPQPSWPLQGQEDTTTKKDKISFYL
jgi:hypothetical protein